MIGAVFGFLLAVASEKFKVEEDPRVEQITEALPGANCGGCGYPGCAGYASAIVETGEDKTLCAPGGPDICKCIAEIMGEEMGDVTPHVAVAACKGTDEMAPWRVMYDGVKGCDAAHVLQGGPKTCAHGCLGLGTCVESCPFAAIRIGRGGIPVVSRELCTGCGACVKACPRGIMKLIPVTAKFYLACNTTEKGAGVKKSCQVGCISCKRCEKKGPSEGGIKIENNLPVIDYSVVTEWPVANEVCPQNCFVVLEPERSRESENNKEKVNA